MAQRLKGKRALIYGGGTGIGFAIARAMLTEGAGVFISSRREAVLKQAVSDLAAPRRAGFSAGDASVAADVERVTDAAVRFLGGLDTIVAAASGRTSIFDAPAGGIRRIIDNNLLPAFLAARYRWNISCAGAGSVIIIVDVWTGR